MSAIKIIQALARKTLTKNQGSGIRSIPSAMEAEAKAGEIAAILQSGGMPLQQLDNFIRSEKDLLKFLNIIENANKPRVIPGTSAEGKAITEKLFGKKGEVVDFPQPRTFKQEIDAMKKSGDLVDEKDMVISDKITDREMFKNSNLNKPTVEGQMEKINKASNRIDEIKKEQADMYKPKSDAEIKAKYDKQNKESIQKLKNTKEEDRTIDEMYSSSGFGKDQKIDAEFLAEYLAENQGKIYDDLATKERLDFYDRAYNALTRYKRDNSDFAKGGRAGFQQGGLPMVDPRMNLDYDTLVEQNVDKRLQDPTFLNNIKDQDSALKERELNPPTTMPVSPMLPVEPRNQPGSLEEYLSGYEDYKAKNPNTYIGTQALIPGMLPGGFKYTFNSGAHANHFNDYLESIGLSPYEKIMPGDQTTNKLNSLMPEDMAKGGRAGFYTGGITDVEPSLDDIGHGADAMMSRTRLMSPGSQATTSTGLNYLLAEDNDNMRIPFSDAGFVDEALAHYNKYLNMRKARPPKKRYKEIPFTKFFEEFSKENRAEGGRIGFAGGGGGRRAFLKLMATLGGGIAGLKSGIIGLGEGGAKKAVTETVKQSAGSGTPPPYFFKLVEKIKTMGDDVTEVLAYKDRQKVTKYKDYELTEDVATGEMTIQRMKVLDDADAADYYGQPLTEETYMSYKPGKGQADETMKGKTPPDEYEQGTALLRNDKQYVGEVVDESFEISDDVLKEVGETITKKADGGRIGFSAGKLATYLADRTITGSSTRFLEKVFGKQKFKNLIENDPEMHRGLLEVAEMFRSKDKAGLVEYMQKFLPQMSKKELESFVVGSGDIAGIEGQLLRLGSGRDYRNKLEMIEEANNVRKLEDFDIEGVSKNAEGGRIGFSGGGILRAIIANSAKKKGMSVTDFIKATNYKGLPPEVKMFLSAEDFAKLKSGQKEMYDNYIDMAKTRLEFQKNIEGGKNTPARELFEGMEKTMDEQSMVPKTVTSDDIAEMELMVKNRFNKGRKDNAEGGLQTMLGE